MSDATELRLYMTKTLKRNADIEFVEGDGVARITFCACTCQGRPLLSIEAAGFRGCLPRLRVRQVRALRDWLNAWLEETEP